MNIESPIRVEATAGGKRRKLVPDKSFDNELKRWIGLFRRYRGLMAAIVFATVGLGALLMMVLTPYYSAKVSILLDPKRSAPLDISQAFSGVPIDTGYVESEVAVIASFNTARRVVEKLELQKDPEFGPQAQGLVSRALTTVRSLFSPPAALMSDAGNLTPEVRAAVDKLIRSTLVRRIGLTYVVDVTVTSFNRAKAATIANAIADSYLVDRLEARYAAFVRATDWLKGRLEGLRTQLEAAEQRVSDYRTEFNLVSTQQGTVEKQQISELNAQLVLARAKVAETKAKLDQSERISAKGGNIAAVSDVISSPVIAALRAQEAEVARREADASARYGAQHPSVINVRGELSEIQRQIRDEVRRITANLRNEFDVAQKREQSLTTSIEKLTGAANKTDATSIKLSQLERERDASKQTYETFLLKYKQTREEGTLEAIDSRVIAPAVIPTGPSFPKLAPVLSIAFILGLFAAVGAAFGLDAMSSGFQTSEQVAHTLGCATLALLPKVPPSELDQKLGDMAMIEHVRASPFSRFSEGIRSVRTGIYLSNLDGPSKVIMTCSTVPGEGKSTVGASVAISSAIAGAQTLLIDMDLRNPATTRRFGLDKQPGLVDLLSGASSAKGMFYGVSGFEKLAILPAGKRTTNPTDVLASRKISQLISALSEQYDLIVIDSPPALAVSDSLLIAKFVDSIVLVVEWNKTAREAVQNAVHMFDANSDKIAGVVFNKVDSSKLRTYSYYNHYYGDKYNTYYGHKS